ncbi:hypothetical protein CHS0354_010868 [Potamilus streckersoni]|uniref:Uncharacterized protein n=1 Tax=Potamilus streckersoni TaxID=2493646 RepID=A0AAE0W001_9BIVA|nr:hypothetical protein CHS0354_010868 [Potamilus streckersoni]
MAFSHYKAIMYDAFPYITQKLNAYQKEMIQMLSFTKVLHSTGIKEFASKAVIYCKTMNIKADWSRIDSKLQTCALYAFTIAPYQHCQSCNLVQQIVNNWPRQSTSIYRRM